MLLVSPHAPYIRGPLSSLLETCSVPSLPTNDPILAAGIPAFDAYASEWKRKISSESSTAVTEEPPIRRMFAEFRNFYTQLSSYVPEIMYRSGKHTFLHRARVAREQEDVIAFREIQNELVYYWNTYLLNEDDRKRKMNAILGSLFKSDKYPSHVWEESSATRTQAPLGNSMQSPIFLDSDRMAETAKVANYNDYYIGQEPQSQQQQIIDIRDESQESLIRRQSEWKQFAAVMCDLDSSPSTIAGDDLYDVGFANHHTALDGEPGPSTKRRRINHTRESETQRSQSTPGPTYPHVPYKGKGKGKAYIQIDDDDDEID